MSFLGRARRFLQELASEPEGRVQYFNVMCASGHRVRGERTEGYQALRCPACGEGVFVLPQSPLPEPVAPGRSPAGTRAGGGAAWVDEGPVKLTDPGRAALDLSAESDAADAEIIWDDTPDQPPRRKAAAQDPAVAGRGPAGDDTAFWEDDVNSVGAAPAVPRAENRTEKSATNSQVDRDHPRRRRRPAAAPQLAMNPIEPRRKNRSPIAAILIVVPLLVATAVFWRYWRQVRAEYPVTAERGRTEGIPALEQGEFDKAHQILSAAKSAVAALGGAVEGANEIVVAADEAAIFVDLSSRILEEMLEDAGRTDREAWASKFETLYKGRAIVIQTTIIEEPGAGPGSRYLVDYVVLPPGAAVKFTDAAGAGAAPDRFALLDFTGFELLEQPPRKKGDQVVFGARLASFHLDLENNVWWVGLEPKSGVFIIHTKALDSLGWPRAAEGEDGLPAERQP